MKKIIAILITMIISFTMSVSAFAQSVTYEAMGVPNINSSFKTWMDYKLCAKGSAQRNFSDTWGWMDSEGFMRCSGEKELGINDDYYLVALGSYYGRTIGTKYKITTDTGNIFYVVLAEYKDNSETNSTNQYATANNNIIEFLIHPTYLNYQVKFIGSANVLAPLNGSIIKIEKMHFNYTSN